MKALTVFTFFICFLSNAQPPAGTYNNYECIYATLFNYSIDNGNDIRKFESRLIITEKRSLFFSVPVNGTFTDSDGDERHLIIKKDTLFKVMKFKDKNTLVFKDDVFAKKGKLYQDTLFPMHWEITGEERMIDSLKCFKASTLFKGRYYTAWYCPKFVVPEGPWKLGGLPGLIIEAYDENRELQFVMKSFKPVERTLSSEMLWDDDRLQLIAGYPAYIKSGNSFIKKFKEQISARATDCLECQTASKIEFHNLENVFQ